MDSHRNPRDYGSAFNRQGHASPRPLPEAKREAANNARVALVKNTKDKLQPLCDRQDARDDSAHNEYLDFVRGKIAELEERC